MSKPKILITGGAGYIGSHASRLFLEKGYPVVVFDNLSNSGRGVIDQLKNYGNLKFIKGDLRDKNSLATLFDENKGIEAVLHFAGVISVGESVKNPYKYYENNVYGSLNLFDTMATHNVKNIVFSSTCAVYGESKYLPVDENHPLQPTNPYGETKLNVERILNWYHKLYGINYVIFRYFNVCGAAPDGELGYDNQPSEHLIPNALKGALGLAEFNLTYSKVKTKDGSPVRDYVNVNDLVEAHFKGFEFLMTEQKNAVINLGTGKGFSVEEIINKVEELTGTKITREFGEVRKGEYAEIYANFSKAKVLLAWEPKRTLGESLESLKLWFEKHPQGFRE
jgi:UDP-glucose 4-epimerase